ncbi:hypothetical protein J1N35_011262 [Gossypium stocksii]|uniref:Uncharacterized protein n=1 Tax=Gossypium stocksii TaxID=47602 RepID=A0A9D3W220_9ROSI|nr:hypothetical protein J1N35_011262 [Gossypium stocksii]
MDSEGKQSLPISGSSNSEPGTEALVELVRKVVEEVLDTKIKEIREMLQAGCLDCKKRKDPSSQRTEVIERTLVRIPLHAKVDYYANALILGGLMENPTSES